MDDHRRSPQEVRDELITILVLTLIGLLLFGAANAVNAEDTFLDNETIQIDQDGPDQDSYYDEDDPVYDEMDDYEDKDDEQEQYNG